MEVGGQLHDPAALLPLKEPMVLIGLEAGWVPEPVWMRWRRKMLPAPAGIMTPVVQAVA
jgi:hypothetical protein